MLTKKERVLALLDAGVNEMNLLMEMSKDIYQPDDFASYKSIPLGVGFRYAKLPFP